MLIRPDVLRRMEPAGELDRIRNAQMTILTPLLNAGRIERLVEQEAIDPDSAYRPEQFLADLRGTIFKELKMTSPAIDAYRRNLQRGYVELLAARINVRGVADDTRPLFRGELKLLNEDIARALPKTVKRETRSHLEDLQDRIVMALDPRFQVPAAPAPPAPAGWLRRWFRWLNCWPDTSIHAQ